MSSDIVELKKDVTFRAVHYNNGDDYHKVFDMINKSIKYDAMRHEYFVKTTRGSFYLINGDWVVLNNNTGHIFILTDNEMNRMFDVKQS